MAETIYADQVTNISIQNGIVRLELAVVDELPKNQNEQIKMRVSHHLVLPLNAFVKAFEIEQTMMNKLVQDGVLKPTEKAPAAAAE
jgi:hypothetical protein